MDILKHINANLSRPLDLSNVIWLEDLSERYPAEWFEVCTQVRLHGGPSLNSSPIPRIEIALRLGLGWSSWVQVQQIAWGWLARERV